MILVIATVNLKEGKKDAYLTEVRKIIPDVQKEDGCIEYMPCVDFASGFPVQPPVRPDTIIFVEKWESLDILKKHMATPHMASLQQATKEMLQSIELQVITLV